ncbi:secernin-1 isoform X1 [Pelobates fuscus]|uniref:secernin-1 isoform X1 n=1 Tax=Pelobates fuscus TaxID=191477 RepID=UPI002FE4DA7B
MAGAPSSYCFVAFPPATKNSQILFGKNSARPRDEVQEVLYVPSCNPEPGSKVQCTYLEIEQARRTHAVILSKPAWMWGAEMGANEHGVCIGNVAVTARQAASDSKLLLGMDLVRLGLERGTTAKDSLDVIVSLLEEHGQGGNHFEDESTGLGFHSSFLIVDRVEAWVLETVGKFWAAEKITDGVKCLCNHLSLKTKIDMEHPELRSCAQSQGWWNEDKEFNFSEVFSEGGHGHDCPEKASEIPGEMLTAETMINILREKYSGVQSEAYITTASAVSVLPQNENSPCIHFFTGTPDPSRSVFKPFIFVEDVTAVPKTHSSTLRDEASDDGQTKWKHELYKSHEQALSLIEKDPEQGEKLMNTMHDLEKQGLEAMEDILNSAGPLDPAEVVDLFYDCVDTEIKFYK